MILILMALQIDKMLDIWEEMWQSKCQQRSHNWAFLLASPRPACLSSLIYLFILVGLSVADSHAYMFSVQDIKQQDWQDHERTRWRGEKLWNVFSNVICDVCSFFAIRQNVKMYKTQLELKFEFWSKTTSNSRNHITTCFLPATSLLLWLSLLQANLRKGAEASVSLLEKDKIMLQHRFTEYQRKADQEAERRRNLENEGDDEDLFCAYWSDSVQFKHMSSGVMSG